MGGTSQTSDSDIVDLLRETGSMCVAELARATDVTPTAVRQRLSRLMKQGIVGRHALRSGRGRPSHRYVLTEKGQRQSGSNFVDLAMVLWQEIRSISEPAIRRGLIARLRCHRVDRQRSRIGGQSAGRIGKDRPIQVAVQPSHRTGDRQGGRGGAAVYAGVRDIAEAAAGADLPLNGVRAAFRRAGSQRRILTDIEA